MIAKFSLNIVTDSPFFQQALTIDYFLLNPHSNYVLNKSVGKDAHRARIRAELLLSEKNNDDVLSATGLGSNVVSSSLTSVGTLTGLTVNGDVTVSNGVNDFDVA